MPDPQKTDLTNCDREPIHIPGAIQPHGCLIACNGMLNMVRRASQNAVDFLSLPRDPVGQPFLSLVGGQAAHEIRNAAAIAQQSLKPGLLLGLKLESGATFDVAVHSYKGAAIVEFERAAENERPPLDLARALVSAMTASADAETLLSRAPRLLRGALGYDRVMIYKFSHDGSGKVVSEAKRTDLEGFLGQYFPASDIPQQARALYLQNTIRIISDASGARSPIEPEFDASGEALDLSFAHLRSVSPIHLEYLRNMGVGASMSISIVVDGKLWGLVACHHYAPRTLSMSQRVAAEMAGSFLSLQIEALNRKATLEAASRARGALDRVMRNVSYRGDIGDALRDKLTDFASFMPCDGVAVWIGDAWTAKGAVPPDEHITPLMRFLAATAERRIWATNALSTQFPEAAEYSEAVSGVLAIPLSQIPKDYLIFFRREVAQTIEWAGDPNKTYESGPLGDRLTPRQSFAIWKEQVERQSEPWTEDDREMAEAARTSLLEVIMRHTEILETERQTADLRQKLLNEELNHRVKNILALIKSLVSQPVEDGAAMQDYVSALKGRIMALANAHDQVIRNDGGGALRGLIEAELTPYRASNLEISGPALGLDSRAYSVLALVLHELATNAAKYGALSSARGRLSVTWEIKPEGGLEITWAEAGGPPVNQPTRKGFGSVLLNRSIPFDLGGESEISYALEGLKARLRIPPRFVSVSPQAEASAPRAKAPAHSKVLQGKNVLLVEDQLIIAIDVETMLTDAGAASIEAASTASEALKVLSRITPDVCVLDVNLGSETSIPVADELTRRAIPFVFATGYGDRVIIPPRLADMPIVRKPYDVDALVNAIATVLEK